MHQYQKPRPPIDKSMLATEDDIAQFRRTRTTGNAPPAKEIKKQGDAREEARIEFYATVEKIVEFISSGSGIARDKLPPVFQNMAGRLLAMNDEAFQSQLARMREEATRIDAIQLSPEKHSSDRLVEQRNQDHWEKLLDELYDHYREYKRCSSKGQTRS